MNKLIQLKDLIRDIKTIFQYKPDFSTSAPAAWWHTDDMDKLFTWLVWYPDDEKLEQYLSQITDKQSYIEWLNKWRKKYHPAVSRQKELKKLLRQPHELVERQGWDELNRCKMTYMGASDFVRDAMSSKESMRAVLRTLIWVRVEAKKKLKSLQHIS